MADPFTSALVSDVVGRLTSAAIQEVGLLWGVENDLLALESTFKKIKGVLRDAEKKQTTQEGVKEWLKTLKSASLEAENVLDKVRTKAMIRRLHREMGKKYRIRAFFSSRYNPVMVRFRIAHKVKVIRKKLKDIDDSRSEFQLISDTTSKDDAGNGNEILKRETCARMPLVKIYGRDEEKKMIVDKICNQDIGIRRDINDVRVYAILGMGGIGKTTLSQLVYNDETVKKHFDLKCWVYVSAVFNVKRIIKDICGLEDKQLNEMSLDSSLGQLQNKLEGKKYFIIMDDVWIENKDMNEWEKLCTALICGAEGSTVMVTTRNEDTAKLMAKNIPELQHNVGVLSDEESWSLFKMLAFPGGGEQGGNESELEPIGRQIVEKCNGLPLAVKSLGSLMSTKETVEKWQRVNKNFQSKIQDNVLPALRLSYDDLPPHMKICFAYCYVFSKGEGLSKDRLIELWMANGFIPSQEDASLYDLGEEIFDSLVGRSFFQDVVEKVIHKGVICKMHDLMHDLALDVMGDGCAVIEPGKESRIPDEVLHLSLLCKDFEFLEQDLRKLRSVRSMLIFNSFYTSNITQISSHVYLRVLYLNEIKSSTLPESICKLIHLRYLKISRSEIKVLPESIIYLQNLQVLILEWCQKFLELPKGLRYMRNLQRIDTGSSSLHHMPVGIKELTNLRRLSDFVVGKDDGARIGELGNLNLLGRELILRKLENVGGLRDAKSANLKDKTNLKSLTLDWSVGRSETNDSEVVEGLEPNSGLHELTIADYMGRVLPSWMVKLVNLTSIEFYRLEKCEQLPPLGKLPSLKRIELWEMYSLKCFHDDDNATSNDEILFPSLQELKIWYCLSLVSLPNNFPKLQSLKIKFCKELRSLPDEILFPSLEELDIHLCESLVSLPSNFPKLRSLKIEGCDELRSLPDEIQSFKDLNQITIENCEILRRRCEKEIGEDWPKISHIPHLNMYSTIYGRDEEKKMIVEKICNQEIGIIHDVDDVRVYAIWGMGGLGKTALAEYVYNHETVKKCFELTFWVRVSNVFDVKRIIKSICGSEDGQLDAMQTCLQNKLCGKKFFIVMDDVWIDNKDMEKWDELCKGLSCGAKGSTVLVTTRKKDIAQRMAKIRELQHNVGVLSYEDSWSLFKMLALPGRGEGENLSSELELVGKEIVKKCEGLPVAVKTLGSLMSTKENTVDEWRAVNDNFNWENFSHSSSRH